MTGFRHDAVLYAGEDEFLDAAVPFLHDAVRAGDPTLVLIAPDRIARLRHELGAAAASRVTFGDIRQVGVNPARIIPAWRDFVDREARPGRQLRGIGEPMWAERDAAEVVECQRHEALLNVAFDTAGDFWLLCPYDVATLSPEVVAAVDHSHPCVRHDGAQRPARTYVDPAEVAAPFAAPLPRPPVRAEELSFQAGDLLVVRAFAAALAELAGLSAKRRTDVVLAIDELATNSICHGGGEGVVRAWIADGRLVFEVADAGPGITDPLAGRVRPEEGQFGGRGLWIVTQVCDLVQMRAFPDGGVVRAHIRLP